MSFALELILALIGGVLGASLGALGGFVLFGLLGVVGYLYLIFGLTDIWVVSLFSGELFAPHICFVGGAVATAFSRRKRKIECGKDIGRSLISLRSFPIIAVGAVAGAAGFLVNLGFAQYLEGKLDTIALTVVMLPLVLKYLWGLTKTNDCEGTSHVLPSPYRFFERLNKPIGKVWLTLGMGVVTTVVTMALLFDSHTEPFAGSFMFFLSALSLWLLFFSVPIPATHHLTGPAGAVVVQWFVANKLHLSPREILLPMLWAVALASFSQVVSDIAKRFLFDEGDIHVDPPAAGIVVSTAAALWVFPAVGVFSASAAVQVAAALLMSLLSVGISLRFFREE